MFSRTRPLMLLVIALLLCFGVAQSATLTGRNTVEVVQVLSGDTFIVKHQGETFELHIKDIMCPKKGQSFFQEATDLTTSLILGKTVTVEAKYDPRSRRFYTDVTADSRSLRYTLLGKGLAWAYNTSDENIKRYEKSVRKQKIAIWSQGQPVAPWDFTPKKSEVVAVNSDTSPTTKSKWLIAKSSDNTSESIVFTDSYGYSNGSKNVRVVDVKSDATKARIKQQVLQRLASSRYDDFLNAVVRIFVRNSQGSGFFINGKGFIVTNYHVVKGYRTVAVLQRGHEEAVRGTVVKTVPSKDLALIEIDSGNDNYLDLSSRTHSVGESVMAIGAPEGLDWSITRGIISAVRTDDGKFGQSVGTTLIQTDTAINPGSSGGPLVSLEDGIVVGVNTFGLRATEGLNFAVGADEVYDEFKDFL